MKNSIEEDIKIALDKFSDNKDIDSAILIVEKFILGNYILRGGRKNIVKDSLRYILSDYKRVLKENEEIKSENRRLKVIRYSTEYGTENIHLITKRDLVEINTNKYFIEIQDGKFVDLKQVYQENKKLNEYKENYIPKDKIEEILSETEITDFNSLVEAFLEIKKLLESEE